MTYVPFTGQFQAVGLASYVPPRAPDPPAPRARAAPAAARPPGRRSHDHAGERRGGHDHRGRRHDHRSAGTTTAGAGTTPRGTAQAPRRRTTRPDTCCYGDTKQLRGMARWDALEAERVAKEDKVEFEGEVIEALPNAMFRVKLDNDHVVLGHVAGKMRRFRIRILPGDRVRCELSPYDLDRARIVYRHR